MLGYPTLMMVCSSILFMRYVCSAQWQQHSIVAIPVIQTSYRFATCSDGDHLLGPH